jgi:hypothetical protein
MSIRQFGLSNHEGNYPIAVGSRRGQQSPRRRAEISVQDWPHG